jgi:hypothetical protein
MEPLPVEGWPNIFRIVFNLLYEMSWRLRGNKEFIGIWVPSPADLGSITYWVSSTTGTKINEIQKSNPALGLKIFYPAVSGSEAVDLGSIDETPWHGRCRILAEQYLNLGDTREALFWLNVGVESLLQERMTLMLHQADAEITEADLRGAPTYWDAAKSLISEQFPDVAAVVKWPESVPYVPSMYRRINFLAKHVPLAAKVRDITKHYSAIQRNRNELFHGENDAPIEPTTVKVAIESLDWLIKHFKSRETPGNIDSAVR